VLLKLLYLAIQERQEKWNKSSIRNWFEIYPQLSIFSAKLCQNTLSDLGIKGGFTQLDLHSH
jgi:hypothetical protein